MSLELLDALTLLSYTALTVDVICQIRVIRHNHSSGNLSLLGLIVRQTAILIIFYKFLLLGDLPLVLGQGLLALTFVLYLILVIHYRLYRAPQQTSVK